MNNEPVAWTVWEGTHAHDLFFSKKEADELCRLKGGDAKSVPLYTHPVKELTDEEIAEIAMQCSDMDEYGNSQLKEYEFARALLLKAQEK